MRSMTGYGQARIEDDSVFVSVELSSVNNRHLEVNFSLPQDMELEKKVKEIIKDRIERGNVDVRVTSNALDHTEEQLSVNDNLLEEYVDLVDSLKQQKSDLSEEVGALDLLDMPGVLEVISETEVGPKAEQLLLDALEEALDEMIAMRVREGEQLKEDLHERSQAIKEKINEIEDRYPEALEDYRDQLKERFDELLEFDEKRMQEEVENQITKYADKSDISEEIVRIESHLKQFQEYLDHSEPVGKELKFLLQEMQREINTIGAKGNDAGISQLAVEVKSELEKCREQVKNVE